MVEVCFAEPATPTNMADRGLLDRMADARDATEKGWRHLPSRVEASAGAYGFRIFSELCFFRWNLFGCTLRYHSTPTDLILPPNATTTLWQRASGAWELAASTDPPPESTALGPLWIATTDAAGVTELLDRRAFAADTVVIPLRGDLPAAPGPIAEALVVHDGFVLEDVLYRLSDSGGRSAGRPLSACCRRWKTDVE
jgi:hypothetical protein